MGLPRSTFYDAPSVAVDDSEIVRRMRAIGDEFETYGYRRTLGAVLPVTDKYTMTAKLPQCANFGYSDVVRPAAQHESRSTNTDARATRAKRFWNWKTMRPHREPGIRCDATGRIHDYVRADGQAAPGSGAPRGSDRSRARHTPTYGTLAANHVPAAS